MKNMARFFLHHDNYLILSHARPDGDTVGCSAALCAGLRKLGKTAWVARNPDFTARYLPYVNDYLIPEGTGYDTVVTVDVASRTLIPKVFRDLHIHMRLDHHPGNESFSDVELVMPEKAACGEVVWLVLRELGVRIDREIALPLYMAIATDSGCFRYRSTSAETMRIAAECIDTGIDKTPVIDTFFNIKTRERLSIESQMIATLEYFDGGRLAIAVLTNDMIDDAGASEDDLENLASIPKQVFGVMAGILIREEEHGCKISVRTSPPYRANEICGILGGGGHNQAGGAHLTCGAAEAKRKLLDVWMSMKSE